MILPAFSYDNQNKKTALYVCALQSHNGLHKVAYAQKANANVVRNAEKGIRMQKRVVFLDIDGTTVDVRGKVPESTKAAIREAKANGHKMVICSGRSRFQIYKELLALGMSGIVGAAGAFVEADGREIYHAYIDAEHQKSSYEYLERHGFLFCYQNDDGIDINQRSSDGIIAFFRQRGMNERRLKRLLGNMHITDTPWMNKKNEKIIYYEAPFGVAQVHRDLAPYFDTVAISLEGMNDFAGEIGIAGINKATGMERYLREVGIDRSESIAVGDGPNDLQMMEYAGIGVAMGNALLSVKERADMVTDAIDCDGLYKAFVKLGLIGQ